VSDKSKTLIPLLSWIDIPSEEDFPNEMYYSAYKGDRGWIMRGPFIDKEKAEESLKLFRHFRSKIISFTVSEVEEIMKIRGPRERT